MKLTFTPTSELLGVNLLADLEELGWVLHPTHRSLMPRDPTDLGFLSFAIHELHDDIRSVEPDDRHPSHSARPELVDQGLQARVRSWIRHGGEPSSSR